MQISELKARIGKGEVEGVYIFAGEEDYLKRYYIGEMRRLIVTDESMAPFVHFVFEGAAVDFGKIADAVSTPSFFGERKLVEWHLADFERMGEKEIKALKQLADEVTAAADSAVVFFTTVEGLDVGTEKRPSRLTKRLEEAAHLVPFFKSGDAQLSSWILRHFSAEGLHAEPSVARAMIERIGHSMDILASEIDKLVCYAKANGLSAVSEEVVDFVCIKTVESDAFSLSNAMLDGKTEDAYRYLGDMKRRRLDPIVILSQISRLYGDMLSVALLDEEGLSAKQIAAQLKMHEYKTGLYLKAAKKNGVSALEKRLLLCSELDAAMKNGTPSYHGLERLVAESAKQTK